MNNMKKLTTLLGLTGMLYCSNSESQTSQIKLDIVYTPKVVNQLVNLYVDRQRELPLCQIGIKKDNVFLVTDIQIPLIYESTDTTARFDSSVCNKNYLGMLHNHLIGDMETRCRPSEIDAYRFISDKRAKIESIVCKVNYPENINISTYFKELIPKEMLEKYK